VTRLDPKPGERIVDIATGTGWASRLVARFGAQVTGVDIAEGMLAGAREIAQEQGLAIDYRLGDAEALVEAAWEIYLSGFGPLRAVAAALPSERLGEMRQAYMRWAAQFRTDLGVALPFDYLVTVGQRL